ncbi:MAG: hypothetical protein IKG81_11275 [Bacteroidales bacterium]|nr:hypothetical protein [Bacteroidales bacterium]
MNITIDKSIFDRFGTPEVNKNTFSKVLHTAHDKYHTISLSKACDINDVVSIIDSNDIYFLQELFVGSITKPEKRSSDCIVKVGGENESIKKEFSLEEVYEYIVSPAEIILENGNNDGFLIRAIEAHFDPDLNFETLLKETVTHIDDASGSGNRGRVEYYLNLHGGKQKFLHCCVIVDSDKQFPTDTRKEKHHKDYYEMYDKLGVKYYVWEKRAMENYMPDEVFIANREIWGRLWVDAYLSLKPEQKDYYNIASGFSKDMATGQPKEYTSLPEGMDVHFNTVSSTNFNRLYNPPSIKPAPNSTIISLRKKGYTIKDSFPTYYSTPEVRYDTLSNRTSHQNDPDELSHVAQMIRQII